MKKKVFMQVSIILYTILALFLAIMGACIYFAIEFFMSMIDNATVLDWACLLAAIGSFFFFGYFFIRLAKQRIILDTQQIYVPGYDLKKPDKMQYKTEILYSEINKISLVASNNNSLNKPVKNVFITMPYIVFKCNNGKEKAINVFCYSKKQVVRIIDEVILRAKMNGNKLSIETGEQILKAFLEKEKNYLKKKK